MTSRPQSNHRTPYRVRPFLSAPDGARSLLGRGAMAAVPVIFLGVMVVWPVVAVLDRSLAGTAMADIWRVLARPSVRSVVGFTIFQATLSTVATFLVGVPVAQALARYRFRGRGLLRAVAVVPFVLPTVVVGSAFSELFDRVGLQADRSLAAIVSAHVFFNVAVVVRVVGGFWATADRRLLESAAVLGAGRWGRFWWIELPRLAPVLAAAAVVVFLFSFTSFGVIKILGGPGRATVETEIFRYAINRGEPDVAAVLAMVQIVVVGALALGSAKLQRSLASADRGRVRSGGVRIRSWGQRLHLTAILCLVAGVVVAPLAVLVERSLAVDGGYGLAHYRRLVGDVDLLPVTAVEAFTHSLIFAAVAAIVATTVALTAALTVVRGGRFGRWIEAASLVPLGVSAVTLGFGYVVGFSAFDLRRSVWLVPLAHSVVGLPFVLASIVPALRAIDPALREAASTLGATPAVVRRVIDWPLVRPAALTGAGFAAAVSIGEFGATAFVARGADSFTAPMAVFRLISQPGAALRGQAMALSVLVGLTVALIAVAMEWRRADIGTAL